jgi:hypothetical protein
LLTVFEFASSRRREFVFFPSTAHPSRNSTLRSRVPRGAAFDVPAAVYEEWSAPPPWRHRFCNPCHENGASQPQKRRRHSTPARSRRFVRLFTFVSTAHAPSRRLQRVSSGCALVPCGQPPRRRPEREPQPQRDRRFTLRVVERRRPRGVTVFANRAMKTAHPSRKNGAATPRPPVHVGSRVSSRSFPPPMRRHVGCSGCLPGARWSRAGNRRAGAPGDKTTSAMGCPLCSIGPNGAMNGRNSIARAAPSLRIFGCLWVRAALCSFRRPVRLSRRCGDYCSQASSFSAFGHLCNRMT